MPDYINEIPAKLSSVIARIPAELSSVENLGLTETFARLPFVERLVLVVAVAQVVLLVLAILIEFSARKRRRVHDLEHEAQQALHATRPEVVPAEEIASWPTSRPPEHAPPTARLPRHPPSRFRTYGRTCSRQEAIERIEPVEPAEPAPAEPAAPPPAPAAAESARANRIGAPPHA